MVAGSRTAQLAQHTPLMSSFNAEFNQTRMNPDQIGQSIQKGMRITLGATASLIEAIQDPQASRDKFSTIGTDFDRLADELAIKGEETEREARTFVDGMMTQMPNLPNLFNQGFSSPGTATVNTVATPVVDSALQVELQTLTEQLAEIRQELEQLRDRN